MNSLADTDIIDALYRASRAGVRVDLNVRGICMLKPGVPGLSENITVISIVDRYLEHSRIFYFANGGSDDAYLSSADWMPRNLERRVELMFPVQQKNIKEELISLLKLYFQDSSRARVLDSQGAWTLKGVDNGAEPFRVQAYFHRQVKDASEAALTAPKQEFVVRRRPAAEKE
jgi:polyphosphate kinase